MVSAQLYQNRFLAIRLPILVLAFALGAWLWTQFFPIAQAHVRFSTGSASGGYTTDAQRYAQWLQRWGVTTDVQTSEGSLDNIGRLERSEADVAFAQGGFGYLGTKYSAQPPGQVSTLANVGVEHFWLLTRDANLETIFELRTLRIGVAGSGSGSRHLLIKLLELWRLQTKDIQLVTLAAADMPKALADGRVDAIAQVASVNSPLMQKLLAIPGMRVAYIKRTAAIYERLPYLHPHLVLRGSLTTAGTQPQQDTPLLSTYTSLIARSGLDPALQRLLTHVAQQVHVDPLSNSRYSEFPKLKHLDFPSSEHARYVLESGLPWWEQHLPYFWAQVLVRLMLIGLPIALVALWLCVALPALLRWRLESQINRWYGELRFIEHDLDTEQVTGIDVARYMARLASVDTEMSGFKTPRALMPRWHTLRQHVDFVRQGLIQLRGR